jgi:hypothetical protein
MEAHTTLLVKNLLPSCTAGVVSQLLDSRGFSGAYDFIYAPIDLASQLCFGYAFVNAVCPMEAERMRAALDGLEGWSAEGSVFVCWSGEHQGLAVHLERYRNSPLLHPSVPSEVQPMYFRNGVRQPFPAPTRKIKAPRVRRAAR